MKNLKFNKNKPIILALLLISSASMAQDPLTHLKKHYRSDDGKLFWNAEKPMYLFASDEPTGAKAARLESKSTAEYANPMYLDTEGINYIRSNWAVDSERNVVLPKVELLFEIYRDGIAPATKVELSNANHYTTPDQVYYGPGLQISVNATDQMSGVDQILYSLNGGAYKPFSTIDLSKEKAYRLAIYSVDNTGNVEKPKKFNFSVDLTAPVSTLRTEGELSGTNLSIRSFIILESSDALSGLKDIKYAIDGGQEKKYTSKIRLDALEDGPHSITYWAVDNVGNKENDRIFEFYLDHLPPTVTSTIIGDQYEKNEEMFISERSTVTLAAEDQQSGLKSIMYSIDGGAENTYTKPIPMEEPNGVHLLKFYAVDNVGNGAGGEFFKEYGSERELILDTEGPKLNYSVDGSKFMTRDTLFIRGDAKIILSAQDMVSGVRHISYQYNNGPENEYMEPVILTEEGLYEFTFFATDHVNNSSTQTFFVMVDNTGPQIKHILSMEPIGTLKLEEKEQPLAVYSKGVTLFLGATDDVIDADKLFYKINDDEEYLEYMKPVAIQETGLVTFQVNAMDKLGNRTESSIVEIFINQ